VGEVEARQGRVETLEVVELQHGAAVGAGDLLIFPQAKSTRAEVIHALRYLEPSSSFRSQFAYDNLLYIVAGEVVARVANTSFEEFLEQRLLQPIGMTDCRATLGRAANNPNKATPHLLVDDKLQTTLSLETPVGSAAGGINCSAASMAKWARFVLDKGETPDGKRIVSEQQFAELLTPVTLLPGSGYVVEHTGAFLNAYALGWGVSTFYGEPLLSHSGGLWGMTTFFVILPEQEPGDLRRATTCSRRRRRAVAFDIADQFLRGSSPDAGKDRIAIVADASAKRRQDAADGVAEAEASRAVNSKPSLPLDAYAGTYRDPWYGDIVIASRADGSLYFQSLRSEPLGGPLEHFQFDTFIARWKTPAYNADAYVSFTLSPEGQGGANPDRKPFRRRQTFPSTSTISTWFGSKPNSRIRLYIQPLTGRSEKLRSARAACALRRNQNCQARPTENM